MKFLVPLALFAIAGVSAQDKKCDADYIVERCLTTETPKVRAVSPSPRRCIGLTTSLDQGLRSPRL